MNVKLATSLVEYVESYNREQTIDDRVRKALDSFCVPRENATWCDLASHLVTFNQILPRHQWVRALVSLRGKKLPEWCNKPLIRKQLAPFVLTEKHRSLAKWITEARLGGIDSPDNPIGGNNYLSQGRQSLKLARLGFIPIAVPPHLDLFQWLANRSGVEKLFLGSEIIRVSPTMQEDGWDGHNLVFGEEYPVWYERSKAGKGVKIAILDTGISKRHAAFSKGRIIKSANFTPFGSEDRVGHGTHCAGIAAGSPHGISEWHGIAPAADLLDVKVLGDDGTGSIEGILYGLEWALENGADVFSMSLGSQGTTDGQSPLSIAVQTIVEDFGRFVAVSAGNSGNGPGTIGRPGDAISGTTVAAIDKHKVIAGFSSRGPADHGRPKPDISAPGVAISAPASPDSEFNRENDFHGRVAMSGTSMAAPFVAGAAALLMSYGAPKREPVKIKNILMQTASRADGQGANDPHCVGSGVLDIDRAMKKYGLANSSIINSHLRSRFRKLALGGVILSFFIWLFFMDGEKKAETVVTSTPVEKVNRSPVFVDQPKDIVPQKETGEVFSNEAAITYIFGEDSKKTIGGNFYDPTLKKIKIRVMPGASLGLYARVFRTDIDSIIDENPGLQANSKIRIGDEYIISLNHLDAIWYRVRSGDTLEILADIFQVDKTVRGGSAFAVATWNGFPRNKLLIGNEYLFLLEDSSKYKSIPKSAASWEKRRAYRLWKEENLLLLYVPKGMTIDELAFHLNITPEEAMYACRRKNRNLQAGDQCVFDVSNLKPSIYTVRRGDSLSKLSKKIGGHFNPVSISLWNNLGGRPLKAGQNILLFSPR
jgi:hypothetical protein